MATDSELKSKKLEQARKANEDRNKARLEMLESIADGSDEAHKGEMQDQDGSVILQDPVNQLQVDQQADKQDETQDEQVEQKDNEQADETTQVEAVADVEDKQEQTEVVADAEVKADKEEELPTDERVVNGTRYYLTIVNGKEKWLTKNQLIERAQKVESADEYLSNAAEAARTVTRPDLSQEDDAGKVEEEDDLEKTLSSAVLGDTEAVKKIASALSGLRADMRKAQKTQPSVTPDVVKEIDSRLAFRNAVEWFEGEYSKELSDPFLKKLIYDKDAELAQATPNLAFKERLKKAGDEVRTWIRGQKGVQAAPSADKADRKKTLVNVPSASQRQAVRTEDEEEESVESVIQQMAKGRGQPRAIVHRSTTK